MSLEPRAKSREIGKGRPEISNHALKEHDQQRRASPYG